MNREFFCICAENGVSREKKRAARRSPFDCCRRRMLLRAAHAPPIAWAGFPFRMCPGVRTQFSDVMASALLPTPIAENIVPTQCFFEKRHHAFFSRDAGNKTNRRPCAHCAQPTVFHSPVFAPPGQPEAVLFFRPGCVCIAWPGILMMCFTFYFADDR